MNKLKKIILTITLCLVLAVSLPLAVFAQEAGGAGEASGAAEAGSAQEASSAPGAAPAPEADVSPTPSPSPSPYITTQQPETTDYDWDEDEEYDEDDLNLDGDEWVSSGGNSSGNVGDTSINTGDATANGTIINSANQTSISSPCSVCVDDVSVNNSGNGSDSSNSAGVDVDSDSTVVVNNDADVDNNLDLVANSGSNVASYNVGDSEIETGDANVSGVVITSANETGLGIVEYNIIEDQMGDVILVVPDNLFACSVCGVGGDVNVQNTGNGEESTNSAAVDLSNDSNTNITNDADLVNNLDLVANSGDNQTSYNTGGDSSITTGDANVAANLLNFANSTISGGAAFIVNVFGDLVGDIIFPDTLPGIGGTVLSATNSGNGSDSTNTIDVDQNNETNTTLNNFADIDNVLYIDANTGGNSTSYNTGGDNSIDTGDVWVNAEVLNVVNTNLLGSSDEPLWFLLVNNMGTWTGQIIGALTGTNYSGSEGFVFNVDENGEIAASNTGNGAGSTNDIDINTNNTNNLTINNTANVTNNINIDANTGNNKASYNTGGDSTIETGDVNVAASIINFVNSNFIGRTVILGIINVFGSWTGDAVPPGFEAAVGGANLDVSSNESAGDSNSNSTSANNQTVAIGGINLSGNNRVNGINGSGENDQFPFGGFDGFGGTIDPNQNAISIDNSSPVSVLGENAGSDDGLLRLTLNWQILLASLIPLILFGFMRARSLNFKKEQVSIAHEVKIKKKK